MKILITGASGLLGRSMFKELKKHRNLQIMGTAHSRVSGDLKKLDLLDKSAVQSEILKFQPDLIIHSAAERRPDVCKNKPHVAENLNVTAVKTIEKAARDINARIIYISTDYVFDGVNPPFFPDSITNPLNHYGEMKLAGEKILLASEVQSIILRVPILYGPVEFLGESSVTQIAEKLLHEEISHHDNDAIRYPTNTENVAYVIYELIKLIEKGVPLDQTYHWTGDEAFTKYTMALVMGEILGINSKNIKEAASDPDAAPRPRDSHLDKDKLVKLGIVQTVPFDLSIAGILSKFNELN
jgi:dTDP-4-dehydrorhamnose reductase